MSFSVGQGFAFNVNLNWVFLRVLFSLTGVQSMPNIKTTVAPRYCAELSRETKDSSK